MTHSGDYSYLLIKSSVSGETLGWLVPVSPMLLNKLKRILPVEGFLWFQTPVIHLLLSPSPSPRLWDSGKPCPIFRNREACSSLLGPEGNTGVLPWLVSVRGPCACGLLINQLGGGEQRAVTVAPAGFSGVV